MKDTLKRSGNRQDTTGTGAERQAAALEERGIRNGPRFTVIHVPHAGTRFPPELMAAVRVPEEEFLRYHESMSDTEVWRLAPDAYPAGGETVRFDVSRLLCDVERFIGPEEEMERYGMGFCYRKAWDGRTVKNVTEEIRERTRRYYDAHHARMDALCAEHPRILLIDLHSFSEETLPEHIRQRTAGIPDVCIGTDRKYTPPGLVRRVEKRLDAAGLPRMTDAPYSGSFVPNAVLTGACACDLISVMLEINKRAYCGADGRPDRVKSARIREMIGGILRDCADI